MPRIQNSVEVHVPLRTAYDQWTLFEDYPRFMSGFERLRQMGDSRLAWEGTFFGRRLAGSVHIHDQVPDRHIAWSSTLGPRHAGRVAFEPLGPARTRVSIALDYEPTVLAVGSADAQRQVARVVEDELSRFKRHIESRGAASGGWRGEIHEPEVVPPVADARGS
jgi:uncharacterized membrane protein